MISRQPTQFWPPQFPVFGQFFIQNHICTVTHHDDIGIKRCEIFLRIFWYMWKVCRMMSPYSNAHANAKKMIFDIQYPGNRFEFGIMSNDFWSSTIWASHIRLLLNEVETPKNPGIQPIYVTKLSDLATSWHALKCSISLWVIDYDTLHMNVLVIRWDFYLIIIFSQRWI